jgi:phospholipid-binding lipoprotein MlaA
LKNFIYNLKAPLRIINNILQGKGQGAEAEVARFLYNTTVGVLGFGNPARNHPGLDLPDEDLGQTLGRWGVGPGFYLVLPGIGPTTLRDTAGMTGDYYLNPINHYFDSFEISLAIWAATSVNEVSLRIGDYETLKNAALDPYQAFRNGYMQLREARIKE